MIITEQDSIIPCGSCGEYAVQREFPVRHGTTTRKVVYQTHHVDMSGEQHHAVYERIDNFHKRAWLLLDELQKADGKLPIGRLIEFNIETVKPSACDVRTDIVPTAIVRVAGLMNEVRLAPHPLEGATAEAILVALKVAAEPIATLLNAQYEARDF
jgi:hypothetical protein